MSCDCDWRCGHEMHGSAVHSVSTDSQTEGKSLVQNHWHFSVHRIRCRFDRKNYHSQQNMDLKLWSQNKGPVSSLEISFIATAKRRSSSSKQDKSTVHRCFFFCWRWCCASWVHLSRSNSKYGILYTILRHLQDSVHCNWPKMWSPRNWQIHNTIVSACATLLSHTKSHKCRNLFILPTLHFVSFFCISQYKIRSVREKIWWHRNHTTKIWHSSFYQHQKQTSTIVLSNRKNCWISTSNHRGISPPLW